MKGLIWIACLCAALFAVPAQAQQYKWVDGKGRTQYGDTPPPGIKATPLRPPPAPPAPEGAAAKGAPDAEAEFRKRRKAQEEAAAKAAAKSAEAETRKENCQIAREQLATLQSGQRISRFNAQGERYFLDDKDRPGEIARARELVSENCK